MIKQKSVKFNETKVKHLSSTATTTVCMDLIQTNSQVDEVEKSPPQIAMQYQFPQLIDYASKMKPRTERVYQFKSRRFDFARRNSHQDKMLVIIHFEGVIGDVYKLNLADESV